MRETQIQKYQKLNELAREKGVVIFGSDADANIPLCELRQAFELEENMYNRSFENLSIKDAVSVYDACVAPINPETVLIHIGEHDLQMLQQTPDEYDSKFQELINHIRSLNRDCRIGIISLRNTNNNHEISFMNQHLKYIAESERCEFGDISKQRVWNPKASKSTASFLRSIGFMETLKTPKPLFDLIRILFCEEVLV